MMEEKGVEIEVKAVPEMDDAECKRCCDVLEEAKAIQADDEKMAKIKEYMAKRGVKEKGFTSFEEVKALAKKKAAKY